MSELPVDRRVLMSDDPRLGRNIEHDPLSRAFAKRVEGKPRNVKHATCIVTLDQEDVGSCTCETMVNILGSAPYWGTLTDNQRPLINQVTAWDAYSETTANDEFPGSWRPDDTGSSGLSAAKTFVRRGFVSGYEHTFDSGSPLVGLNDQPFGLGAYWYSSFDEPDNDGVVTIKDGAYKRGGHEFMVYGDDVDNRLLYCQNSWGPTWGVLDLDALRDGVFLLPWEDFDRLIREDGDVIFLTPRSDPPPDPDWDQVLARELRPWATSRGFAKWTKAGKAAAASRLWLEKKGL